MQKKDWRDELMDKFCVMFERAQGEIVNDTVERLETFVSSLIDETEKKAYEKGRNEMRRKLYEVQDEVEVKKEKLLEGIEAQLKQKSKIETLFTISWKII